MVGVKAAGVLPDCGWVDWEGLVGGGRRRRVSRVWRGGMMSKVDGGRAALVGGFVGEGGRVTEGILVGLRATSVEILW